MESGLIEGINPSITKLVYLINFWGVQTYQNHAGFYPGDTEEQEYWTQKCERDEEYQIELFGPIAIWGVFFHIPYVYFLIPKND